MDVGRDCDGLIVVDPGVRAATSASADGDKLVVTDLGSTNGTTLNGQPLTGSQFMGAGDVVGLGDTQIRVLDQPTASRGAVDTLGPERDTFDRVSSGGERTAVPGPDFDPRRTSIAALAAVVEESERAAPAPGDGNTVTIVFSDIDRPPSTPCDWATSAGSRSSGSTTRSSSGRSAAGGGTVVKSQGDGYMLTFSSARRALACSVEIQRRLRERAARKPDTPFVCASGSTPVRSRCRRSATSSVGTSSASPSPIGRAVADPGVERGQGDHCRLGNDRVRPGASPFP